MSNLISLHTEQQQRMSRMEVRAFLQIHEREKSHHHNTSCFFMAMAEEENNEQAVRRVLKSPQKQAFAYVKVEAFNVFKCYLITVNEYYLWV